MERTRCIVVAIDFGEESQRALTAAIEIADGEGAELHAIYVDQPPIDSANVIAFPPPPRLEKELARLEEIVRDALQSIVARKGSLAAKHATVHGAIGAPAIEIARLAAVVCADLVVVGTHGRRGLDRAFLGSVAEKTVRLCGCPVLVVRSKHHAMVEKIPEVEPPCAECVQRRFETKGKELWCARHATHHPKAHVYTYEGPSMEPARPWGFG